MTDRNSLLDDEFVRATPGLRPLSLGVMRLGRKLGVTLLDGKQPPDLDESTRQVLILTWLLDERHSLETIKLAAEKPEAFPAVLEAYEFSVDPQFVMMAQQEATRTAKAIMAAAVSVQPKPVPAGTPAPPTPPGN